MAGTARNPLSVPLPAGTPVAPHDMTAFAAQSRVTLAQIRLVSGSQLAALE
jgi:hypothetical protein